MPSPFPGMDPYVEINPLFQEIHTQILSHAQVLLQPQLQPKYVARLERHLSEGSVWDPPGSMVSLAGKEPDISIARLAADGPSSSPGNAHVLAPTASLVEELEPDEQQLRKQRRLVIYINARPRLAVTSIELLSPSNKTAGTVTRTRYLEKRSSALHGGLHWVEIDLLRAGQHPPMPLQLPERMIYLVYIAQATPTDRHHLAYGWALEDHIPFIPIPLLGNDRAELDLAACFQHAYDAVAAGEEVDYTADPPPPRLNAEDQAWADRLLRDKGMR